MAYKNTPQEEHAFKRIDREIKNNELKNLLFFYGREKYLIRWAKETLIKLYLSKSSLALDFTTLDGSNVTIDEIINNCETLSMMSEKRIVLISDFKLLEGGKTKGISEADEKQLIDYLKHLPESCMLVLTADRADKRKKLYKTIAEFGGVYEFSELDDKQLRSLILKRLKEAGKTASPAVISEFITESGYFDKDSDYTLDNLDNDIKKAVAYSDGNEITVEDILGTVSGNLDRNIFELIDSLSKNKKEEAFQQLHNLLVGGEKEYRILALICSQFEIILAVKEMKDEGKGWQDIKNSLGIHEFRIKKAAQVSEGYSRKQLYDILRKAYDVDKNIKTGILEASLALEMFIAEI